MALFNFGKKKAEQEDCCCSCSIPVQEHIVDHECCGGAVEGVCCIKVLGAGCKSCHDQYENVEAAVKNLELGIHVEYITDMQKVMEYGVMSMPAIVINEKVVAMGKVLKTSDVENILRKYEG